ncbi:hypothetical protein Tco_0057353 [Tanacetum coccineum]
MKKKAELTSLPDKWEEIVTFMTEEKHNRSIKSILRRVILAACVYFIWYERNKRLFTGEKRCSKILIEEIILHLRIKLASITVKSTRQIEEVGKKWKVHMNVLKDQIIARTLYLGVPLVWLYPFESSSTLIWPWEGSELLDVNPWEA